MWHLLSHANDWLGRSLHRRFVSISLGLLLVVQLASFLVIDGSLRRHALAALPGQLAMGERTVQKMLEWRGQRLIEGARLLAADFGFRAAVQSRDRETIASVLSNHGARIAASEVALLDTDFSLVAVAEGSTWDARADTAAVARLARADGNTSELAVLRGELRQMVLVPMRAPLLVGWVLMYFPVPSSVADDVHDLAAAELTLLARPRADAPWTVAFSRLPNQVARAMGGLDWRDAPGGDDPGMLDAEVAGRRFGVRALRFTPGEPAPAERPEVLALLTLSVDDAVRPPRDLQLALLATTLLGFVAFGCASAWKARRITTPLQTLAQAAERLGAGDADTPIRNDGSKDEVHELARAFEHMRTSLAATQERIVQSEKLASIGQLAAGVAHEINNPIGFVFSNFGALQDYLARLFRILSAYREEEAALAEGPALRLAGLRREIELDYLLEDIPVLMSESNDGLRRVRKIVQDLKDFSHVSTRQEWDTVDLHAGLDATLNIVSNEIRYKADVVKQYGPLPPVECLPGELNQVFMNLLVNAAHAMGEVRGTITIRSGTSDDGVWVEVQDTGAGIARENLSRIFDPFFTTKPVGKGTGLGLALSYGIVRKHGGRIDVASEVGVGTTFRVWIPASRPPA